MKKKTGIILILSLMVFMLTLNLQEQLSKASDNKMAIPKDAIRLRILANSDHADDQRVKREVRDVVNHQIEGWVQDLKTAPQAKQVIQAHLGTIRSLVKQQLIKEGLPPVYTVKLGEADFPTKLYGGTVYPAGQYQALVVTLGKGQGANWWCVLFPPLCFLDFEHGDAVKPDQASQNTAEAKSADTQASGTDAAPAVTAQKEQPEAAAVQKEQPEQTQTKKPEIKVEFFAWEWAQKAVHLLR